MGIPAPKIVQLVGAAPSIATDPVIEGAERWLFNASYLTDQGRPYTRVFNLHVRAMILGLQPYAWAWYGAQEQPVYLLEPHGDIPSSVAFPLDRVREHFAVDGGELESCFGCTIDYLIALALYEGFTWIDLMGIEVKSEEEYREQRASIQYWMGRARGMGVRVTCSAGSGLGTVPALYGYNIVTGAPPPPGEPVPVYGHPYSMWPVPERVTTTA